MSNHRLPIEIGRYKNIPRKDRLCKLCSMGVLGDEFHFLFECEKFASMRKKYLPEAYLQHCSVFKFRKLFQSQNNEILIKVAMFIKDAGKLFI